VLEAKAHSGKRLTHSYSSAPIYAI